MLEKTINGTKYVFDNKGYKINVNDNISITIDQVRVTEDNQQYGFYVCSCSPDRNPRTIFSGEKLPKACEHIKKLRKDEYLHYVVQTLYSEKKSMGEKADFLFLWGELLEGKDLLILTDLMGLN